MRILLVDDEEEVLEVVRDILETDDHTVLVASEPKDALEILNQEQIHLVITDLSMPEMNGQYFIEIIRIKFPTIPIMVLSAHIESEEKLLSMGVIKAIPKPATIEVLLSAIKELSKEE